MSSGILSIAKSFNSNNISSTIAAAQRMAAAAKANTSHPSAPPINSSRPNQAQVQSSVQTTSAKSSEKQRVDTLVKTACEMTTSVSQTSSTAKAIAAVVNTAFAQTSSSSNNSSARTTAAVPPVQASAVKVQGKPVSTQTPNVDTFSKTNTSTTSQAEKILKTAEKTIADYKKAVQYNKSSKASEKQLSENIADKSEAASKSTTAHNNFNSRPNKKSSSGINLADFLSVAKNLKASGTQLYRDPISDDKCLNICHIRQEQTNWCWATDFQACAKYFGYNISAEQMVNTVHKEEYLKQIQSIAETAYISSRTNGIINTFNVMTNQVKDSKKAMNLIGSYNEIKDALPEINKENNSKITVEDISPSNIGYKKIVKCIEKKQPVVLAIMKPNGSKHAIICDGHRKNNGINELHIVDTGTDNGIGWYKLNDDNTLAEIPSVKDKCQIIGMYYYDTE